MRMCVLLLLLLLLSELQEKDDYEYDLQPPKNPKYLEEILRLSSGG